MRTGSSPSRRLSGVRDGAENAEVTCDGSLLVWVVPTVTGGPGWPPFARPSRISQPGASLVGHSLRARPTTTLRWN